MNKVHQLKLLSGIAADYLDGLVDLGHLIHQIEALLGIINDSNFRDVVFDDLFTLEQIYAATCCVEELGEFDFPKDGKPVVDAAARAIVNKANAYIGTLES